MGSIVLPSLPFRTVQLTASVQIYTLELLLFISLSLVDGIVAVTFTGLGLSWAGSIKLLYEGLHSSTYLSTVSYLMGYKSGASISSSCNCQ